MHDRLTNLPEHKKRLLAASILAITGISVFFGWTSLISRELATISAATEPTKTPGFLEAATLSPLQGIETPLKNLTNLLTVYLITPPSSLKKPMQTWFGTTRASVSEHIKNLSSGVMIRLESASAGIGAWFQDTLTRSISSHKRP
ncbi:MAG: hypothetical protein G01um101466_121 [Parcubacteria group bacterium Gr01-1014_66]|nr:MAG: hypothetical protein G01um101466_121 [Parcubacteria group bacterium Gr01-1014_66]